LAFEGQVAEAQGISTLVQKLIEEEGVPPHEILVLLRTDYNKHFSRLIEEKLDALAIESSDPEAVGRMLGKRDNRWLLAAFRLLVHREDALAWATLLHLIRHWRLVRQLHLRPRCGKSNAVRLCASFGPI
jgi:hypothetical protein